MIRTKIGGSCALWCVGMVVVVLEACACCDAHTTCAHMDMTNAFSHELRMLLNTDKFLLELVSVL